MRNSKKKILYTLPTFRILSKNSPKPVPKFGQSVHRFVELVWIGVVDTDGEGVTGKGMTFSGGKELR